MTWQKTKGKAVGKKRRQGYFTAQDLFSQSKKTNKKSIFKDNQSEGCRHTGVVMGSGHWEWFLKWCSLFFPVFSLKSVCTPVAAHMMPLVRYWKPSYSLVVMERMEPSTICSTNTCSCSSVRFMWKRSLRLRMVLEPWKQGSWDPAGHTNGSVTKAEG